MGGEIIDMLVDEQMSVNNPIGSQANTSECVRTVLCNGDCYGQCELDNQDGSSLKTKKFSA